MILADTSVWIELLNGRLPATLSPEKLLGVVTCGPIVQEVLQGFTDERPFMRARESMLALPIVESPLEEPLFLEAVQLYRSARRAGLTIRSSTDCVLAACAIRHHLTIAHVDRDYDHLAKVSTLQTRRVRLRI